MVKGLLKELSLLMQVVILKEWMQYFPRDCEQQTWVRRLVGLSSHKDPPMLKSVTEGK